MPTSPDFREVSICVTPLETEERLFTLNDDEEDEISD